MNRVQSFFVIAGSSLAILWCARNLYTSTKLIPNEGQVAEISYRRKYETTWFGPFPTRCDEEEQESLMPCKQLQNETVSKFIHRALVCRKDKKGVYVWEHDHGDGNH